MQIDSVDYHFYFLTYCYINFGPKLNNHPDPLSWQANKRVNHIGQTCLSLQNFVHRTCIVRYVILRDLSFVALQFAREVSATGTSPTMKSYCDVDLDLSFSDSCTPSHSCLMTVAAS